MSTEQELQNKKPEIESKLRLAGRLRRPQEVFATEGPDISSVPEPDQKALDELDKALDEPEMEPRKEPQKQEPEGPRLVTLDQTTLLKIELLATKKKLAEANEKIATIALQDAKKAIKELAQEEAELLVQVRKKFGVTSGNVRLLDREKGVCQVG